MNNYLKLIPLLPVAIFLIQSYDYRKIWNIHPTSHALHSFQIGGGGGGGVYSKFAQKPEYNMLMYDFLCIVYRKHAVNRAGIRVCVRACVRACVHVCVYQPAEGI